MRRRHAYTHRIAILALLAGTAGCDDGGSKPGAPTDASDGGGPDDGGDGGDGGGPDDGGPESGVTIEFHYLDASGERVPVGDEPIAFTGFTITNLTMQLHRLELVGDTAKPGDLMARSRVLDYPLQQQPRISFPTAPEGIYSRLTYRVERTYSDEEEPPGFEGARLSARVRGVASVTQGDLTFEYREEAKVDIDLDFNEWVEDEPGVIEVDLDLGAWFTPVNWQALADDDDGGDDDSGGPGGDDDGGPGGDDDGGEDDDGPGPGPGGADISIGMGGDRDTGDLMREALESSFRVPQP